MSQLFTDLRVAARALARQRAFTVVSVLTLALGVGATTAIFSVVYGVLLRPLPYERPEELVAIGQTQKSSPGEPVSGSVAPANFRDWQQATTVSAMALYSGARAVVTTDDGAVLLPAGTVTPGFFRVFEASPILGRDFSDEENRPDGPAAVVISHGLWMEWFGGRTDVLGRTLVVTGRPREIVGVAPAGFGFPAGARLWFALRNDDAQCGRGCVYTNGIARLAPGVTIGEARAEFTRIAASLEQAYPEANTDVTIAVQSLQDRTVGSVKLGLSVLLAAVGMVLLIACANVANLLLVRGTARQSEVAVRAALGAGRGRIVMALLAESLLLALGGGLLGVVVAAWGVDVLKALAPAGLPRVADVRFDLPSLAFAVALVVLTTVLFGLGPSLRLAHVPLSRVLGQRGSVGGRRGGFRSALLVTEVALSLVLLLGAGLLLRSLGALQSTDPGFRAEGLTVFTMSLPAARYPSAQVADAHERVDALLQGIPGVTKVARIAGLPLGSSENVFSFRRPDLPAPPPGRAPSALARAVDADYFETMGIPITDGRGILTTDREGAPRVIVISRRMAEQFWPGETAVGRPIAVDDGGPEGTVVGVAADVRSQGLALAPEPEMYAAHAQSGNPTITYVLRSSLPSPQVIAAAREVIARFDRALPLIEPGSVRERVDEQLAQPRFYLMLLSLFAVLAVVLAAVGIYGVVAYVVAERSREIGVRMALGSSRGAVIRLMLWQGLRPAAAGLVLGLAAALALGRVVQSLLYDVEPHDPLTFAAVTVALLAVVVVASALPARRASAVPPAEALRGD